MRRYIKLLARIIALTMLQYFILIWFQSQQVVRAAPFTPGNLVIYRVGDGAGSLVNTGNAVFLDEYTTTGSLVQSIALPTTASGANKPLIASGTATSEGFLTRSSDGRYLLLSGYGTTLGGATSLPTTTAATVNRVIGRVDSNGNIDTSTALTDAADVSNPRSATSADGATLWITGGAGGIRSTLFGQTTSTQLSTTVTNLRQTNIFNGQLYVSDSSGTAVRLGTVGSGLPTTSGQTITNLPGFPTTGSPYGFFFADLDAGVSGLDTLYVAADDAAALTKYSMVGGSWVSNGIVGVDADDYRGLTGLAVGSTVTLFAVRKGGSGSTGGGELVTLVDASGYNGAFSGTPTLLASSGTNRAFRGVALAPFTPSAVRMDGFTAKAFGEKPEALLEWKTGFEVDNLGYNIYREEGGKRTRINPGMIGGSALLAAPGVSFMSGRSYAWSGEFITGKKEVRYWLEEIDLNGSSTWHGPITVEKARDGDKLPPPARPRAVLLADIGNAGTQQAQTTPVSSAAKPAENTAARLAVQSDLSGRAALKLSVKREGWYRVSAQELFAAGLDSTTDPRMFQLFVDGEEQPCIVDGEADGRFDPSDALEFYGLGLDTSFSDTRVYWLGAGSQQGRRIEQVKGKGSRPAPGSFPYTVERKERTIYFSGLRNGDSENFFGAVIAKNPLDQTIIVQHLDNASPGDAAIEVALQGVNVVEHRVSVALNGTAVGEVSLWGQSHGVTTFSVSPAALKEGSNIVTLTPTAGESDVTLVDYIRITYPHTYTADNNDLKFSLSKKQQVTIDGFNTAAIRVLDISDPNDVREVSSRVEQQGNGYAVTVSAPKGGLRTLRALTDDHSMRAEAITPNRLSSLRDRGRAADLVIITHRDFLDSVNPLKTLRESQGLAVEVVDLEDVFDEFSYGHKSPEAIKDFLAFTNTSWQKRPRFVLFVGDASFDPKNYLGRGDHDFAPTKLVDSLLMETASDDWFADFNGDGLAEMALGRLPARTAGEASRIIGKIVGYESAARMQNVLLVSDLNDGIDFRTMHAQLRDLVPAGVSVVEIDRGQMDTVAAKSRLIDGLNSGLGVVSYYGHGTMDQWRGNLLTSAEARELSNGRMLPVFFTMTCLNGYFVDPQLDSVAESLLKAERGGAVAVWASSGLCDALPQAMLEQEMFRFLFAGNGDAVTLGEAAMKAKGSIKDTDVRQTYILFGDPSSRLR